MATTTEGAIQEALLARVATLVLNPIHPVAWPNNTFVRPPNNRFLEVRFVPNGANRVLIDSDGPHQRIGLLQINVRDELNKGPRVMDTAGLVAAHFATDMLLRHAIGLAVRITAAPDVSNMLVETTPPGVLVAVMVPYEVWA